MYIKYFPYSLSFQSPPQHFILKDFVKGNTEKFFLRSSCTVFFHSCCLTLDVFCWISMKRVNCRIDFLIALTKHIKESGLENRNSSTGFTALFSAHQMIFQMPSEVIYNIYKPGCLTWLDFQSYLHLKHTDVLTLHLHTYSKPYKSSNLIPFHKMNHGHADCRHTSV